MDYVGAVVPTRLVEESVVWLKESWWFILSESKEGKARSFNQ